MLLVSVSDFNCRLDRYFVRVTNNFGLLLLISQLLFRFFSSCFAAMLSSRVLWSSKMLIVCVFLGEKYWFGFMLLISIYDFNCRLNGYFVKVTNNFSLLLLISQLFLDFVKLFCCHVVIKSDVVIKTVAVIKNVDCLCYFGQKLLV